jgi:ADP-ribose pyrophosphatase YjhB (NUDIX family)
LLCVVVYGIVRAMRTVCDPQLLPLAAGTSRGWILRINGADLADVGQLELRNPRFGSLRYGLSTQGYDTWNFHEVGGGGAVIAPYAMVSGELVVGVVKQMRLNQYGEVWNLPRGFVDNGELHVAGAARELREETGLMAEAVLLPGEPANPNSAFFVTPPGEGVRFYAARVQADLLRGDVHGSFLLSVPQGANEEHISALRFVSWREAIGLADMFTVAGVGRLLAYIHSSAPERDAEPGHVAERG